MIETGVLIGYDDEPLYWHEPEGRSAVYLPDSRKLWDKIWELHQANVLRGFAHSHPGSGRPWPSHEDVTTCDAVERALGRSLMWWVTSRDRLVHFYAMDDLSWAVQDELCSHEKWLPELRRRSYDVGAWFQKEKRDD